MCPADALQRRTIRRRTLEETHQKQKSRQKWSETNKKISD